MLYADVICRYAIHRNCVKKKLLKVYTHISQLKNYNQPDWNFSLVRSS